MPQRQYAAHRLACAVACLLLFGAAPAMAQFTISIIAPSQFETQGDPVPIHATVRTSATAVTSMQATIEGRTVALTPIMDSGWFGSIAMTGIAAGQHKVTVTATNAGAEVTQAELTFTYDPLPVLTVTSPADGTVTSSADVRVQAQCTDNGPQCEIRVSGLNGVVAVGLGSIDTTVGLLEGSNAIVITASDAIDPRTTPLAQVSRQVMVLPAKLTSASTSFPGAILDIDATRALVLDRSSGPGVVRLVDRATSTSEIIYTLSIWDETAPTGRLTPLGALFTIRTQRQASIEMLHEWRSGTLVDLGAIAGSSLVVKGNWALYGLLVTPPCCFANLSLIRRDLVAGTNTTISSTVGHDLAPDGRVVYSDATTLELYEFSAGPPPTTTPLTSAAPSWSRGPLTDGNNVVFVRMTTPSPGISSLVLRKPGGVETVLVDEHLAPTPYADYRVAGGWVAYTIPRPDLTREVWLRAPDGSTHQVSQTSGFAIIEALSDTGDIVYRASFISSSASAFRYLARLNQPLVKLGPAARDFPVSFGGEFWIAAGPNLLAIDVDKPIPTARAILAEGATGSFFTTDVAILNPNTTAVTATVRYLREGAPEIQETRVLSARSRLTIHENDIPGLENAAISTVVEAPQDSPLVVDRLMTWDRTAYGGHLGSAVSEARRRWMFAEGSQGFFFTYFLLANSGPSDATVRFTFLVEQGSPVTQTVTVAAGARKTLYAGDVPALVNTSFATTIESDQPIVAERAMYFGTSPFWQGGHGTAGVSDPFAAWTLSEGATGSFFDTFILIANPNPIGVALDVVYFTEDGKRIDTVKFMPASSRLTINVEQQDPRLASAAVSTLVLGVTPPTGRLSSLLPIVVERAVYWGDVGTGWREAHNSFGRTVSGSRWGLAEGRVGGAREYQTYILVSGTPGSESLKVTFLPEGGTPVERTYTMTSGRLTINASDVPELANTNFGMIVEGTSSIAVESAIYWNVNGVVWEGGGNTVATRLPTVP